MKNKEETFRLVRFDTDNVQVFDSASQLCECIVDEKIEGFYVIKSTMTHEKHDISRELSMYKQKQKDKAEALKAAGKNKPDVEVVVVQGEVKDDPAKKVQGKRPRLSHA